MPIVCPRCATTYLINSATLGAGRNVRCARCGEVWMAKPKLSALMLVSASREPPEPKDDAPSVLAPAGEPSMLESPPLAVETPSAIGPRGLIAANDLKPGPLIDAEDLRPSPLPLPAKNPRSILPTAAIAVAALVAALIIWRTDMVRLMPQTAGFYRLIGLDVNTRGLAFRDVKFSTDQAEGKIVLVVAGKIESRQRAPLDLPRLHLVVRNAQGTAIYSWNAKTDQAVLKPGENADFRASLVSPPLDARTVELRFVNRRDLAAGAA